MGRPRLLKDERKARRLFDRGWRLNAKGAHSKALPELKEALALYTKVLEAAGEWTEEPPQLVDALRVKSHKAMADTLTELAFACYKLRLADEAISYSQQSMEHYREAGDGGGECGALNDLAKVYELMLMTPAAIEHYHEALTLAQEIGDPEAERTARMSLFRLYTQLRAFDEAKKYL